MKTSIFRHRPLAWMWAQRILLLPSAAQMVDLWWSHHQAKLLNTAAPIFADENPSIINGCSLDVHMVTWDFHGIFDGFSMDFHGFSMDFRWIFMGFSLVSTHSYDSYAYTLGPRIGRPCQSRCTSGTANDAIRGGLQCQRWLHCWAQGKSRQSRWSEASETRHLLMWDIDGYWWTKVQVLNKSSSGSSTLW